MTLVIFDIEEWEHKACLHLEPEHDLACTRMELDEVTAAQHADAEGVSTFVASKLSADVLARMPRHQHGSATSSLGSTPFGRMTA